MVACSMLLSSCMLLDAREQQALLNRYCSISGDVRSERGEAGALVVLLIRRNDGDAAELRRWEIVDYYVTQKAAPWRFALGEGTYRTAAFDDVNADLIYQPGEPFVGADRSRSFECVNANRYEDVSLAIPATSPVLFDRLIDVGERFSGVRSDSSASNTLGQLTAIGVITDLSDPRFSQENAEGSLWRPHDFIVSSQPGIYFLEPYDERKTPVLFVHGIGGTPANFAYLIARLDRTRYQPWLYLYPSGVYLDLIADHLSQTVMKLQVRYDVERLVVVAHSMGGLVARGFVLRHAKSSALDVPLFVTLSTPWAGHAAAGLGVKHSPVVLDVWRDMAPGSEYLQALFAESLPTETQHHLIFTFSRDRSSFGASDDQAVTVASQLDPAAQAEARRIYGYDDTHRGILRNDRVAALMGELLSSVEEESAPPGQIAGPPGSSAP